MKSKISELQDKYPIRDFVEDPLEIVDALLLILSFSVLIGLTRIQYVMGDTATVVISWLSYLVSFAGIILVISDVEREKYLKSIALAFLVVILISSVAGETIRMQAGSDVDAFAVYSAELVLEGKNPYEEDMIPSVKKFEQLDNSTPLINGGNINSQSYPSPSFLYLVPQVALGYENPFITSSLFLAVIILLLMVDVKPKYSLLSVLGIQYFLNIARFSPMEYTWVALTMLGLRFWQTKRYASMFFLGLAYSFKQIPWFTAPFLMIWILKENETYLEGGIEVFKQFGVLGTVFLIPNIPFIIDNPMQWLQGVFTPLSSAGTLVQMGEGFVRLSLSLGYIPQSFFTVVMALFSFCLLGAYWFYFDEAKWIAWITPALILWFNYRSASKYMLPFIPIVVYIYLVKNGYTADFKDSWREGVPFGSG